MFDEEYCDKIILPTHQPPQPKPTQTLGWNPQGAKTMLISTFPLIDHQGVFFAQKSSQMLENMIYKVLHLTLKECAIFSLYKSQNPSNPQDIQKYREILIAQILQSPAECGIIFGLEEVANILFPKHALNIGSSIKFRGKKLLITHPLKALIRMENLKKQTLQDLKNLKALL